MSDSNATRPLQPTDFAQFFEAIHGCPPFPWQRMLLERVVAEGWPDLVDLPTASGKTACIDVAVFAMALRDEGKLQPEKGPRRLWFVVDRRIVVDEAYRRALTIADALQKPTDPVVAAVAERLKHLSSGDSPLIVSRLRGGKTPSKADRAWVNDPRQPAIITSTVDQVGSRLLFRSYGCGPLAAPVHAALAAYDSLIILDEAHCAVPFQQTIFAVRSYLDPAKWSRDGSELAPRLGLVVMSATLPESKLTRFPRDESERANALENALLFQRRRASKSATMELAKGGSERAADPLVVAAARHAKRFAVEEKRLRVAVMVNRVKTAQAIASMLCEEDSVDVVLLTGRMRPIDRDDLVDKWSKYLRSSKPQPPDHLRPIIVVTTQCLEVGADFSFDALVTECASIDALIQRFGRLDRLGELKATSAVILARGADVKKDVDDPVYGVALAETWSWLSGLPEQPVDFGIDAIRARLESADPARRVTLLSPRVEAPALMPSHLDLLCQTAPRPTPEPEIAFFLHGEGRGEPQVRIAFRSDVIFDGQSEDQDVARLLELIPPVSIECLSVSLWKMRRFLLGQQDYPGSDVEGERTTDDGLDMPKSHQAAEAFVILRSGKAHVSRDANDLLPNDTIVLSAATRTEIPAELGTPYHDAPLDRAEDAANRIGRRRVLRISHLTLGRNAGHSADSTLLQWATETRNEECDIDGAELNDLLQRVADAHVAGTADNAAPAPPPWLREIAATLAHERVNRGDLSPHPTDDNGWIIRQLSAQGDAEEDDLNDEEALEFAKKKATLNAHTRQVVAMTEQFSANIPAALYNALHSAAVWHDAGKLDDRFQHVLRDGNGDSDALAKSIGHIPPRRWQRLCNEATLPDGFRHEMLSAQLFEQLAANGDGIETDLTQHLIESHHGHGRPAAPELQDSEPPAVAGSLLDSPLELSAEQRRRLLRPQDVASGVTGRFWRLTRRYGWWGLAYLESMLRLADWHASRSPGADQNTDLRVKTAPRFSSISAPPHSVLLHGLDGSKLPAFLAALGVLRLLDPTREGAVGLSWELSAGAWRACLHADGPIDEESLLQRLKAAIAPSKNSSDEHPIMRWSLWMPGQAAGKRRDEFRAAGQRACLPNRIEADLLTAIGSDGFERDDEASDSPLRAPRADYLLGNLSCILSETGIEHLRKTLFASWAYDDPLDNRSLKFDPSEDRRHALQWAAPTADKDRKKRGNMLGANRLAIEALAFFTSAPTAGSLDFVALRRPPREDWQITWPVWRGRLSLDSIASLLAMPLLQFPHVDVMMLKRLGIVAAYRVRRQTIGKTRVFSPAAGVF